MPKKKKKLSNSFCEIKLLSEKLTTDGQTDGTDDGQLGKPSKMTFRMIQPNPYFDSILVTS